MQVITKENTDLLKNKMEDASNGKKETSPLEIIISGHKHDIQSAASKYFSGDQFVRLCLSVLKKNKSLETAAIQNPESLLTAMIDAATLGLEPNTSKNECCFVPYNKEIKLIIQYGGWIALAYRSGKLTNIEANVICKNDTFSFEHGTNRQLKHIPNIFSSDRGPVIGYYAILETKDKTNSFVVASKKDVEKHAEKYSASFRNYLKEFRAGNKPTPYNNIWVTNFDSMAKKTMIINLLKFFPKSIVDINFDKDPDIIDMDSNEVDGDI